VLQVSEDCHEDLEFKVVIQEFNLIFFLLLLVLPFFLLHLSVASAVSQVAYLLKVDCQDYSMRCELKLPAHLPHDMLQ
jgi:hypothetical protein